MSLRRKISYWAFAMAIFGWGAGSARADFAPLKVGNEWRYRGASEVRLYANGAVESSYRDSLFARTAAFGPQGIPLVLKDTVINRTRTYFDHGSNEVSLKNYPGQWSYYSFGQGDFFFYAHDTLAAEVRPVSGAKNGYAVFANVPKTGYSDQFDGWNVVDVGMFWWKKKMYLDDCGYGSETRELLLTSFNGKPVDLGISPPGLGLPKQAQQERAACGIRIRRAAGGLALAAHGGGVSVNALGRAQGLVLP